MLHTCSTLKYADVLDYLNGIEGFSRELPQKSPTLSTSFLASTATFPLAYRQYRPCVKSPAHAGPKSRTWSRVPSIQLAYTITTCRQGRHHTQDLRRACTFDLFEHRMFQRPRTASAVCTFRTACLNCTASLRTAYVVADHICIACPHRTVFICTACFD